MAEILLHKQEIPADVIDRLASEGVITIRTDNPDDFRFLSLEPAAIRTNDFLWAALDAMQVSCGEYGNGSSKRLVKNLAELAREQHNKVRAVPEGNHD